jgi:hypothetical protein
MCSYLQCRKIDMDAESWATVTEIPLKPLVFLQAVVLISIGIDLRMAFLSSSWRTKSIAVNVFVC